jgi:hypothetical protein
MPGSIEESEPFLLEGKVKFSVLSGFSICSFLRNDVRDGSIFPGLHLILLGLLFVSSQFLLVNFFELFDDVTSEGGFSRVNVSNEDYIGVLLGQKVSADIFGIVTG